MDAEDPSQRGGPSTEGAVEELVARCSSFCKRSKTSIIMFSDVSYIANIRCGGGHPHFQISPTKLTIHFLQWCQNHLIRLTRMLKHHFTDLTLAF